MLLVHHVVDLLHLFFLLQCRVKVVSPFFQRDSAQAPSEKQRRDGEDGPPPSPPYDSKWLGSPISDLRRMPQCGRPLPPLKNTPDHHTVMIRVREREQLLGKLTECFSLSQWGQTPLV